MFHVLSYVRPFAFPQWAFRAIRIFRIFRFFQAFRTIRTMLRAAIWHEKRG